MLRFSKSLGDKGMEALVGARRGEKKYMEKIERKYKVNANKTAQEDSGSERASVLTSNGKKSFGHKKSRKTYEGIYKSNIPSLKSEVSKHVNDAYQPSNYYQSKLNLINSRVSNIKVHA